MSRWLALTSVDLDLVLRLSLATLMGGLIGINRDLHGKPAGVRTHALVALGAALILIVAERLPGAEGAHVSDAQSRVIQGLITGIGFLGAGVILHSANEKHVHGLTTAAAVWMAALLGAACSRGFLAGARDVCPAGDRPDVWRLVRARSPSLAASRCRLQAVAGSLGNRLMMHVRGNDLLIARSTAKEELRLTALQRSMHLYTVGATGSGGGNNLPSGRLCCLTRMLMSAFKNGALRLHYQLSAEKPSR